MSPNWCAGWMPALAGIAWEAIFVDDNSPDGTAAAVKEIAARTPGCAACAGSAAGAWRGPASKAFCPAPRPMWR